MCLLVTAQELRKSVTDPLLDEVIDHNIADVERDFMKPEFQVRPRGGGRGAFWTL